MARPTTSALGLVTLFVLAGFAVRAQESVGGAQDPPAACADGAVPGHPHLTAVRIEQPPRVDGRLDDPAWQRAARSDAFRQRVPVEQAPPSERTEVMVAFDADHLYIGIRCHDRNPGGIRNTQMERDARLDPDDRVEIVLDTFLDRRYGYFFQINPGGGKGDALLGPNRFDKAWDGIFEARATTDSGGWSAEFAIPFKTVSFSRKGTTWGFNVARHIRRRNEVVQWSGAFQHYSLFNLAEAGEIRGLTGIDPGVGVDVKPFMTATAVRDRNTDREYTKLKPGFDAFIRLTRNTTAAVTVNTDFAETEVDSRQVNLTRFPLFFPEKRDFFLQDSSIFNFADFNRSRRDMIPFFSRRIGLSEDERVIPILAGVKVTGREGPVNFGVLDVMTDDKGDIDRTNHVVARGSVNLGEQSTVGMMLTYGDPQTETHNTVFGLDAVYRTNELFGDRQFRAGVWGARSWTSDVRGGDEAAYGAFLDYPNDLFRGRIDVLEIQDEFNARLGFVPRTGIRKYEGKIRYRPRPHTWIRQFRFGLLGELITDTDDDPESSLILLDLFGVTLESGDEFRIDVRRVTDEPEDAFEIWDGVVLPAGRYDWIRSQAVIETAEKRPWVLLLRYSYGDFYSGERQGYLADVTVRPCRFFSVGLTGDWNDIDLPEGDFITRVYRGHVDINFAPGVSWSNLVQYDNASDSLGLNSRFRWNYRPGANLFVVLNHGWEEPEDGGRLHASERKFSVKVEYTFRF